MVLSEKDLSFGESGFAANRIGNKENFIISNVGFCHTVDWRKKEKTKYYLRRDKIVLKKNGRIKRRYTVIKKRTTCY